MASDPITVLHLSDVQFGRHHRFASSGNALWYACDSEHRPVLGLAETSDDVCGLVDCNT